MLEEEVLVERCGWGEVAFAAEGGVRWVVGEDACDSGLPRGGPL